MSPKTTSRRLERNLIAGLAGGAAAQTRQLHSAAHRRFRRHRAGRSCATTSSASSRGRPCRGGSRRRASASTPTTRRFPLFGLPRVVSTAADARLHPARGRQPGERSDVLRRLLRREGRQRPLGDGARFAQRIHFAHLRNVTREADGSFYEAEHLEGSVDMPPSSNPADARAGEARARGRGDGAFRCGPTTGTCSPTTSAKRASILAIRSSAG